MPTSARSSGKKRVMKRARENRSGGRGRVVRDAFKIIKFLRGGRRTYREISVHMGWAFRGISDNKTAKRWIESMEASNIPVQSYRYFENDPLVFWLDKEAL